MKASSFSRVMVGFLVFFAMQSCKKEIDPGTSTSDLQYFPFGENSYLNAVLPINENELLALENSDHLIKLEGTGQTPRWRTGLNDRLAGLVRAKNGDFFALSNSESFGLNYLSFSKISHDGSIVYQSPAGEKLVANQPTMNEQIVAVCADGGNGFYAIVFLDDYAGNQSRVLVHVNETNTADQILTLYGFYVYMTCDPQGNLFLIRTVSPEGFPMELEMSAVKMDVLRNSGFIQSRWKYYFGSLEPDWKWTNYLPYQFHYDLGHLFVIMQHLTGVNDQSDALQLIDVNPEDGSELNSFLVPFDNETNNYNNQATFHPLFTPQNIYLAFNFGSKSKLVKLDRLGKPVNQTYLSGDSNKTFIKGIGMTGNRVTIFGISTLGKSPTPIPFRLNTNK